MSNDYALEFDLSSYGALDNFALLADQKYNLGDKNGWFNCFRGGLEGLYARVLGVKTHYYKIHAWEEGLRDPLTTEYHLSSIFFNMDSSIECVVFTLNAFGYIADSNLFVDITDDNRLKRISPYNIIGKPPKYSSGFIPGYDKYFPSCKEYWCDNRRLISDIIEQHDVSKHRQAIYIDGRVRNDPSPDFLANLGIKDKTLASPFAHLYPMSEIILMPQPKTPWHLSRPSDSNSYDKLESVAEKFCVFINLSGLKALEDARETIKLNYHEFTSK